jgi:hypothetical protein
MLLIGDMVSILLVAEAKADGTFGEGTAGGCC